MAARTTEIIKEIVKKYYEILIQSGLPVEKVFLFGSYARNEQNKYSDIDFAVVLKEYLGDRFNTRFVLMKYAREFAEIIEPHPFLLSEFDRTNPFVKEIIQTGEVLYS
ncbi:dna polymerase, beta domain protein region [hydrocarbon metagenome]|uniref:Dna polymerase, beta domain protein region n=1 Tax=hydrocarbon metagenome TaxID=938273 RepID=A0A0W8G1Y3_9ZZZZ